MVYFQDDIGLKIIVFGLEPGCIFPEPALKIFYCLIIHVFRGRVERKGFVYAGSISSNFYTTEKKVPEINFMQLITDDKQVDREGYQ